MADSHDTSVLVVEDESGLVALYRQFLEAGYHVETAETASDALAAIGETTDVMLLDRHLPDRNGDAVLDTVRDRGYDLPVAMVSAIEPDLDILDLAIDAYVTKPVGRDRLHEVVRRVEAVANLDADRRELHRLRTKRRVLNGTHVNVRGSEAYEALTGRIRELENRMG